MHFMIVAQGADPAAGLCRLQDSHRWSRNVAVYLSADTPKVVINKYLVQQVAMK